jgi:hypothetical protein
MIDPSTGGFLQPQVQQPTPTPAAAPLQGGPAALAGTDVPQAPAPAADAAAPPAAGGSTFAQQVGAATQEATKQNPANGKPGTWAQNIVAGAQNALAGFAVSGGTGALQGIGEAAKGMQQQRQQQFENQLKTQQAALEAKKADREQTNQDREYQLHVAENLRQQAKSVQDLSEHDMRLKTLGTEDHIKNFELVAAESNFRQGETDKLDALHAAGGHPLMVAGKPVPDFDNLGDAAKFASANDLAKAHNNDYRTRPVFDQASGKYKLIELPDTAPKLVTVTGADNKPVKIWADPTQVMAF